VQLERYGLDVYQCNDCLRGGVNEDREWTICVFHAGFIEGFEYALTLEKPPVTTGAPTTIIFTPGIPQPNQIEGRK
jgi:hypothetical protein